ncbi:uncharacterized protein LOC108679786 [Hyalella azteca]|uniref:Uncharacterized protein LOC108679786 n=1 Tax=Hyalella azteca TaxID=294128 RepID=A0A8B7PDC3_HYAAZ|nr:uncharacterized protein LOC108679786 [Hyalella azteca]
MNETVDKCCPSSYDCTASTRAPCTRWARTCPWTAPDLTHPGVTVCRIKCVIILTILPLTHPGVTVCRRAKIECSIVECPSLFSPPKPGCRNLFSIDECCEVDQECHPIVPPSEVVSPEANATIRPADCVSEGLHYFLGDKILFGSAPCQYCVCTKEFTGAFGPGCTKVDCGMEYRNRHYLRLGCIPLYLSASCCNVDWICPGSPQIILDADMKATGAETPSTHGKFGDLAGPVGSSLTTYDCHISCTCATPPEFTCVRYPTCEVALQAQKAGYIP